MEWHFANNDTRDGPVSDAEMAELVREGVVHADTLVWHPGLEDWEPAHRHIEGLTPPPVPSGLPRAGSRGTFQPGAEALPEDRTGATGASGHGAATRDYTRKSDPVDAAREFFSRYVDFAGRSNRGEYWFWMLDNLLITFAISLLIGDAVNAVWSLATFLPSIALGVRRLHDIGRSGWWLLIGLVPLVGLLVLIYWACQPPEDGPNRYA